MQKLTSFPRSLPLTRQPQANLCNNPSSLYKSMMPLPTRAPSRALCSSIELCERTIARRGGAAVQQRRWESTEQKKGEAEGNGEGLGKSFKGQLYVSTANRLIKERAERQRFAIERGEDSSGRTWSITFSESPFTSTYAIITSSSKIFHSNPRSGTRRLLARQKP